MRHLRVMAKKQKKNPKQQHIKLAVQKVYDFQGRSPAVLAKRG